jgi:oxygen-dependent protoporphyrinogen oxidase
LGLEDRLLNTNDEMRKVFVLSGGKPIPLPDGVLLIVPTRFMPFALSPLLSPFAKLRMGLDLVIPAKRDGEDETIAEFIRRRLGNEALDKIAEPLMSGIYNAEAEKQSLLATFPRFRALEEEHGSLIRGMLASRKAHAAPTGKSGSPAGANNGAPARKPSMFTSLQGGTRELVDTLVGKLAADTAINMRLGARIEAVEQDGGAYTVVLSDGNRVATDAVILATPSYIAARLVDLISTSAAKALSNSLRQHRDDPLFRAARSAIR